MTTFPERSLEVKHFDEPGLEFDHRQVTPHPKDGLFLYGPHEGPKKAREVNIGVIGTAAGIAFFKTYAAKLQKMVEVPPPSKREKKDRLHLANFPGMEQTFNLTYDVNQFVVCELNAKDVANCTAITNHHEAVARTAAMYIARARKHVENDERNVTLWVLVIPEFIYERCRPQSKRTGVPLITGEFVKRQKKRTTSHPLLGIMWGEAEEIFDDVPDFHRQIKAAFLKIAPTQLVRETTIAPESFLKSNGYPIRGTQDAATIAWNLATGLYYKTQPKPPWKLANTRPGVCYIGLVYKNIPNDPNDQVCCAAQMFLAEGDGVVFRGANGPWRTGDEDYHLKPQAAKDLITKVLETYAETHDGPPKELFIHGQTYFNAEEWDAFVSAAPKETNIVGVRIRTTGGETKLFRDGDYPVLRGTALMLDQKSAYLWTTGYVPQLDTYIGPETPNPLFVTALRSKDAMPAMDVILRDIMGLTKINYNSCNFNDGLPVTVRFAKMVGNILVMGSAKGADRQPFKYYV